MGAGTGQHPAMPTVRILLVEDEPLISCATADFLGDFGFVVAEAATASEAMALLLAEEGGFGAAIIDIGLPDRPGDILAREMWRVRADLQIVIASGRGWDEIAPRFDQEPNIAFVRKPYDVAALLEALRALNVSQPGP
jgi:DNA-binding response OmpR family regulator